MRTPRLLGVLAPLLLLGCGTDAPVATQTTAGISVSGVADLMTTIPFDTTARCTLTDHGDRVELQFKTNPATEGAVGLSIDITSFSGKAGQVYSDIKGRAATDGTIVVATASNNRIWDGGSGSVTVDTLNGTLVTGSIAVTLNPDAPAASNGLTLAGHWECITEVATPSAPAGG